MFSFANAAMSHAINYDSCMHAVTVQTSVLRAVPKINACMPGAAKGWRETVIIYSMIQYNLIDFVVFCLWFGA